MKWTEEGTPITWVQTKRPAVERAAHLQEVCPGLEPDLPPYHGGVLPQHLQTVVSVIPGRIEPSFPDVTQVSLLLDHGDRHRVDPPGLAPGFSGVRSWRPPIDDELPDRERRFA